MHLVQSWVPTVEPTPDHYLDNSTCLQWANTSSKRQRCWHVEWTWLVSRPTWSYTSFNASHLVRSTQLHHRYCCPMTRDVRILRFCVHRILPRIGHPTQNLGSCAELRKIYHMAQKMWKFCWFLLTLLLTTVKITQYTTRCSFFPQSARLYLQHWHRLTSVY